MVRFVLLIAFVACANRANTAQDNATDCTTEGIAALAVREVSNAYRDVKEAGVVADTFADSIAVAVVDSVAYAAYDSLFASLRTIFGPEAAAFDQYMDAKQAFYAGGTPIDETALSNAFAVGKYFFNAAGVMHRLTAAEIIIWGNEYYPAWARYNVLRTALNTSYYTSKLCWGLETVSETAEQAALTALTLDCSQ